MADDIEHLFMCFLIICIFSWKNVYSDPLSDIGLFVFLLLSCKSSLHVLDTSPLSDI